MWFFSEKDKLYQSNPEYLDILMNVFQDNITNTYRMHMIWSPDGKWLVLCLFDSLDPSKHYLWKTTVVWECILIELGCFSK